MSVKVKARNIAGKRHLPFTTTTTITMVGFFRTVFSTIYTFFAYIYTFVLPSKRPRHASVTPYPTDLECGTQGWFCINITALL